MFLIYLGFNQKALIRLLSYKFSIVFFIRYKFDLTSTKKYNSIPTRGRRPEPEPEQTTQTKDEPIVLLDHWDEVGYQYFTKKLFKKKGVKNISEQKEASKA